ncbi:hypothetical protein Tco_0408121 [Tanacetum coccineum]
MHRTRYSRIVTRDPTTWNLLRSPIGERAQHKMEYVDKFLTTRQRKRTQLLSNPTEFNNEGKVDQNAEQCHDIRPLPAKLTDDKTIELSDQSLES